MSKVPFRITIQKANTDGAWDWVADPDASIVYVSHELTGVDYAHAAAEGTRALFKSQDYPTGTYRGPGHGVEWTTTRRHLRLV